MVFVTALQIRSDKPRNGAASLMSLCLLSLRFPCPRAIARKVLQKQTKEKVPQIRRVLSRCGRIVSRKLQASLIHEDPDANLMGSRICPASPLGDNGNRQSSYMAFTLQNACVFISCNSLLIVSVFRRRSVCCASNLEASAPDQLIVTRYAVAARVPGSELQVQFGAARCSNIAMRRAHERADHKPQITLPAVFPPLFLGIQRADIILRTDLCISLKKDEASEEVSHLENTNILFLLRVSFSLFIREANFPPV